MLGKKGGRIKDENEMNKIAKFFGIAAVVMFALLIMGTMMGGGIESELKKRGQSSVTGYADARQVLGEYRSELETLMKRHRKLFAAGGLLRKWQVSLSGYEGQLDKAQVKVDQAKVILDGNDAKRSGELKILLDEVDRAKQATKLGVQAIYKEANGLADLLKNARGGIAKVRRMYGVIEGADLAVLKAEVEAAIVRWPGKREDLLKRFGAMETGRKNAKGLVDGLGVIEEAVRGRRAESQQILALAKSIDLMSSYENIAVGGQARLRELMGQLDWSWDKMLVDLEIIEGHLVTFKAKYKTVKVSAVLESSEAKNEKVDAGVEAWHTVDKGTYEKLKDNMGMTVAHKPAGKYDHEVIVEVQPAGYRYMASKQGGRNRYGYWSGHGGGSFWMWYGQYYFMRSMFWGYGYSPIYYGGYSRYHGYRGMGRTYYGRNASGGGQRYGSKGSHTKSRYSGSKYAKSGGYSKSRYVSSGGKYRGTKYQKSSSYRSSSYRSGGYSGSRRGGFGGK